MNIRSRATRPRARRLLGAAAAALVFLVLAQPRARADAEQIRCTFFEVKASNEAGGIDPKLRQLRKKLEKPPLSSWKRFTLVARHDKKLSRMKAEELRLELGLKLQALYHQHVKPAGRKDRFALSVILDKKSGERALDTKITVDTGDYFVIALTSASDSSELLALTCMLP